MKLLGADHLTFEGGGGGGGVILKIISCKAILNKKNTCTNKPRKKISCPIIWWEKNVAKQYGCRDRFDQSQKISWFDFQGLV
jgi:hypothetical protein